MAAAPAPRGSLTREQIWLIRSAGFASVAVALVLVGIKLVAWLMTDSVAVLSSFADSLLDLLASSITLIAVRFAFEPADREHRFGHGKLEAIASLVQACVILGSVAYVGAQAFARLVAPAAIAAPAIGTGVIIASLALTIGLVIYQRFVVRRTGSIAIGADRLHYTSDVLGNLVVLLAIAASSGLGWHWADPVFGLVVVAVILKSVREIVRGALDVLLDRELPTAQRADIYEIVKAHPEVLGVHDLRTRTSGTQEFIQFHIELRPELDLGRAHEIAWAIEAAVMQRFPRAEVMIHADPYGIDEPRDRF